MSSPALTAIAGGTEPHVQWETAVQSAPPELVGPAPWHGPGTAADGGRSRRLQAVLTAAVLDGATSEELVALVATLLGNPVALLDHTMRARFRAAPAGGVRGGAAPLDTGVLRLPAVADRLRALEARRPSAVLAPVPAAGLTRRHLVCLLRAGGDDAGYLDVIEAGTPFTPASRALAELAAVVLSVQMGADAARLRSAAQADEDVVADLLRGTRSIEDLRRLAVHVGVDPAASHLLVRFPVASDRCPDRVREPVVAAVATTLPVARVGHAEPAAVTVLVRLPSGSADLETAAHRAVEDVLDAVAGHTGLRRAVLSAPCRDLADVPAAHEAAREVDEIVTRFGGRSGVVPVSGLETLRLVVNGDRAAVAVRFARQCLGPLRDSDEATGGDLVETLRRYLGTGAQIRATAKALGVHENTVRYRLGRIQHVTGMDVRRFDALLAAQLAFQVDDLLSPRRPA